MELLRLHHQSHFQFLFLVTLQISRLSVRAVTVAIHDNTLLLITIICFQLLIEVKEFGKTCLVCASNRVVSSPTLCFA